jgi:hypothetical protein
MQGSQQRVERNARAFGDDLDADAIAEIAGVAFEAELTRPSGNEDAEAHTLHASVHKGPQRLMRFGRQLRRS